jgi:hypothetical protein
MTHTVFRNDVVHIQATTDDAASQVPFTDLNFFHEKEHGFLRELQGNAAGHDHSQSRDGPGL